MLSGFFVAVNVIALFAAAACAIGIEELSQLVEMVGLRTKMAEGLIAFGPRFVHCFFEFDP